ncbi:hypothetical protein KAH94_02730 [bacterium]|nr:hypothetical protein [bacterium]
MKQKNILFTILSFILLSFPAALLANSPVITFLKNHKSLLKLEEKIEHMENQIELHENIVSMINEHIIPLLETSKNLHKTLKKNKLKIDNQIKKSLEQFENTYKAYTELLQLLNRYFINLETKMALQELEI